MFHWIFAVETGVLAGGLLFMVARTRRHTRKWDWLSLGLGLEAVFAFAWVLSHWAAW